MQQERQRRAGSNMDNDNVEQEIGVSDTVNHLAARNCYLLIKRGKYEHSLNVAADDSQELLLTLLTRAYALLKLYAPHQNVSSLQIL